MSDIDRAFVYFEQFKDKDVEDTLCNAKQELTQLRADLAVAVLMLRAMSPDVDETMRCEVRNFIARLEAAK